MSSTRKRTLVSRVAQPEYKVRGNRSSMATTCSWVRPNPRSVEICIVKRRTQPMHAGLTDNVCSKRSFRLETTRLGSQSHEVCSKSNARANLKERSDGHRVLAWGRTVTS
jgi:hypothetical protein